MPVGIFITRHVYSLATITGSSMQVCPLVSRQRLRYGGQVRIADEQPTFNPDISGSPLHHDVVLLERWSVALNKYQRGDVVTLWSVPHLY